MVEGKCVPLGRRVDYRLYLGEDATHVAGKHRRLLRKTLVTDRGLSAGHDDPARRAGGGRRGGLHLNIRSQRSMVSRSGGSWKASMEGVVATNRMLPCCASRTFELYVGHSVVAWKMQKEMQLRRSSSAQSW